MISNLTKDMKIFVAGHGGMVGSAIIRKLIANGFKNIITRNRTELDLLEQASVNCFLRDESPDYVIFAAAKVGGIFANNEYPAEFIYQNLMMQCNVINSSYLAGVNNLLFLGSSCIYPKSAEQPMKESALLKGYLEPTNEPYAVAKIAGIKMCESYNRQYGVNYRSLMPTNLYGPNDNYHGMNSHVIPALIKNFHEAKVSGEKKVVVWGTGSAKREFLHVDDMAAACFHVMGLKTSQLKSTLKNPMMSHINVGSGVDISIAELAKIIKQVVEFDGDIEFDKSKPDGAPRKLLDVGLIKSLGWSSSINLEEGLLSTYNQVKNEL